MLKFSLTKGKGLFIITTNGERMINGGLMTIEDLADYLKVTRRTIYEWLKQNKIPAVKLIGQWRFRKDRIDAWIENHSKLQ
ncbi:MAG: helix-turn-helix domain-containing protein [Candidatus Omnitrophota bacterium]|jgi:excisionase family DNA binding protein